MIKVKFPVIRYLQLCLVSGCLLSSAYTLAEEATVSSPAKTPEENVRLAEEAFDKSDIVSAMRFYRKAAEAGYGPAMSRLAYLLDKSEEDEEAITWLKKAVQLGEAEGQFELARMYAYGEGIKQDKKLAFELFKKSANQQYTPAIRVLALAYENGDLGLRADYELAQHWLRRGQLANDYWSLKRLAQAYRKGDLGLRINHQKAEQLEQQLAPLLERTDQ